MTRPVRILSGTLAIVSCFALPLNAQPTTVTGTPPVELAPSGSWVMNYDDDSCSLHRRFGEDGQQVNLELRKFGPSDDMQVVVASKDFAAQQGDFLVQFVPVNAQPQAIRGVFNIAFADGFKGRLFPYNLSNFDDAYVALYDDFIATTPVLFDAQRDMLREGAELNRRSQEPELRDRDRNRIFRDMGRLTQTDQYQAAVRRATRAFQQSEAHSRYFSERYTQVTHVSLYNVFDQPVVLRTGGLKSAMEAMEACLDELVGHWGVDVEAHRTLTRVVEPLDYDRLVREMVRDYPAQMVRQGMPAIVRVRLDVSAEGEPTGCHMQSGISDPSFEEIACRNMMRFARFYPALDASGQPIASYFQVAVQYII